MNKVKQFCKENVDALIVGGACGAVGGLCVYLGYRLGMQQGIKIGVVGTLDWLNTTFQDMNLVERIRTLKESTEI